MELDGAAVNISQADGVRPSTLGSSGICCRYFKFLHLYFGDTSKVLGERIGQCRSIVLVLLQFPARESGSGRTLNMYILTAHLSVRKLRFHGHMMAYRYSIIYLAEGWLA
jgi:hypothetical protein